jgi:GT2 family glycosyltransferase
MSSPAETRDAGQTSTSGCDGSTAVIVVNWNAGETLLDCLAALERQTVTVSRTIVVDNGSTDGSIAAARARFPHIEVMMLGRNTGFAHANNVALEHTDGVRWVALLNPDARPEPRWLEELLRAATAHAGYAFFASRLLSGIDPELLDGAGDSYHFAGLPGRAGHGLPAAGRFTTAREVFSACAAAALYRRDILLEAGGFDDRFFCYLEDVDLGFRLRLRGHRCLYVPGAVVHHLGSRSSGRGSDFYVYHGQRNLVWTFLRNIPGVWLWVLLLPHLALNLVALCHFTFRGQASVAWRAKRDALIAVPELLRDRRIIQASRRVRSWHVVRHMTLGWPGRRPLRG